MNHAELLAKIDESIKAAEFEERYMWTTNAKVLRAVVEIHKPYESGVCGCELDSPIISYSYPCKTIRAIEKGLND